MKTIIALFGLTVVAHAFAQAGVIVDSSTTVSPSQGASESSSNRDANKRAAFDVAPVISINSRSTVIPLNHAIVFIDPVGAQSDFRRFGRPDIVVLTRATPGHLSIDTMIGMLRRDTVVLAPQAVIDQLPLMISNNVITPFNTGTTQQVDGITFRALDSSDPIPSDVHIYGRDRGDIRVLMDVDGQRIYF